MHAPITPIVDSTVPTERETSAGEVVGYSLLSDTINRMVAVFLEKEVDALLPVKTSGLLVSVMSQVLESFVEANDGRIVYITELRRNCEERPANYRAVHIGGRDIRFLTSGWVFITFPDHRIIVYIGTQRTDDGSGPLRIRIYGVQNPQGFLRDWTAYARKHNYLRGQTVYASGDPVQTSRQHCWDDIILSDLVRQELKTHVETFLERLDDLRANGLKTRRGVILAGPPGTGKTLLGKVLASTLKATFLWVLPRHMESTSDIADIFAAARFLSPTVLFFEDIDLIGEDRERARSSLLGELMNQLDGASDNDGIVTIATTNRLEVVEKALRSRPGRFDRVIEVGPPDSRARHRMLERLLVRSGLSTAAIERLVAASDGLTPAELEEAVNTAYLLADAGEEKPGCIANGITEQAMDNTLRKMVGGGLAGIGFKLR